MKRTISGSVLKKRTSKTKVTEAISDHETAPDVQQPRAAEQEKGTSGLRPRMGAAGSAWKAGALSDAQQMLSQERENVVANILAGRHELRLLPDQISDTIGSDRRDDWRDQPALAALKDSIERNGQDTPIQIWPADPDWRPDERDPENVVDVKFLLIVGRRRHAILKDLGRPVRALLVPADRRGQGDDQFEMLFMRFRENEQRENLSAFERLLSIGEMFERFEQSHSGQKITASMFAERIGVPNSAVSRGKAVFRAREKILHACKNVYALSHRELEQVLGDLAGKEKSTGRKPAKPKKLTVVRTVGQRKLSVTGQGGRLSVTAGGLKLDEKVLNGLGDVIAAYLNDQRPE